MHFKRQTAGGVRAGIFDPFCEDATLPEAEAVRPLVGSWKRKKLKKDDGWCVQGSSTPII